MIYLILTWLFFLLFCLQITDNSPLGAVLFGFLTLFFQVLWVRSELIREDKKKKIEEF